MLEGASKIWTWILRRRRPTRWLATALTLFFVSTVFLLAHDQRFVRYVPWLATPASGEHVEEETLLEEIVDPHLCRIANASYTCLGTSPAKLPAVLDDLTGRQPTHAPLPAHCIDAHFAAGEPCAPSASSAATPRLDVVWIWTNGSDPLFRGAISDAETRTLGADAASSRVGTRKGAKLYRDHDELRYSLRSVLQHFDNHARRFHLLTTDVGDKRGRRYGLLPQWLDFNVSSPWKDGDVQLDILHHSQVFKELDNSTFNSFSIESQLHSLTSTSEPFIYMNDDFFFTRDLTTSDFYSSAYGIVLRLDPGLNVPPSEWPIDTASGEWQPLKYSDWLLSERFGSRARPYMVHVAKTVSPSLLQEIHHIWKDEFATTALHRFRGQRDVYTTFLHSHYLVERWRELLLWSWVVAKIGGDDDSWTEEDMSRAWGDVGGVEGFGTAYVRLKMRDTLEKERVRETFEHSGEPVPAATSFVFSSLDGYPYALTYENPEAWPKIAEGVDASVNGSEPKWKGAHWGQCRIIREKCFPPGSTASQIFHTLMYTHPESCGDCVIQALVTRSGPLGLDAFLPPYHRIHYSNAKGRVVEEVDPDTAPRLPLAKRPQEASFTLREVLRDWGTIRVRDWVLRAMERYRFVIGETPVHFGMLTSSKGSERLFEMIDGNKDLALLTINDDVTMRVDLVDRVFRTFLNRRWGFPSAWENLKLS